MDDDSTFSFWRNSPSFYLFSVLGMYIWKKIANKKHPKLDDP